MGFIIPWMLQKQWFIIKEAGGWWCSFVIHQLVLKCSLQLKYEVGRAKHALHLESTLRESRVAFICYRSSSCLLSWIFLLNAAGTRTHANLNTLNGCSCSTVHGGGEGRGPLRISRLLPHLWGTDVLELSWTGSRIPSIRSSCSSTEPLPLPDCSVICLITLTACRLQRRVCSLV